MIISPGLDPDVAAIRAVNLRLGQQYIDDLRADLANEGNRDLRRHLADELRWATARLDQLRAAG